MESMMRNYGSKAVPTALWPELRDSPVKNARDCIMSMGLTSENVASRYGVSRSDQDAFAAESHRKASFAQREGHFDDELVPVTVTNPAQEATETKPAALEETVIVSKDDGIRHSASVESMARLKPVFRDDGTSTAGNSSQVSDGAAAVLMMRRAMAELLNLSSSIIGKFVNSIVVGVAPDEMGIGPAIAIPKLLDMTSVKSEEVKIWEINEAFASQALHCIRALDLEGRMDRVNPRGGGIALGHPLGATGARMVATCLHEMKIDGDVGIVSMCVGTGMGMAGMVVKE